MYFAKVQLKNGFEYREEQLSNHFNLLYSVENSVGKTTFLRLVLYGLGYNIPSTRNLNFNKCEVTVHVVCDDGSLVVLTRFSKDFLVVKKDEKQYTFLLDTDVEKIHKIIFGIDNSKVLENLLGVFYFDQEKGWTLLNRGKVIGSIHFNVDSLIQGLANFDFSDEYNKIKHLDLLEKKYKQMFNVSKYSDSIEQSAGILVESGLKTFNKRRMDLLLIEKYQLEKELKVVKDVFNDNKNFANLISKYRLMVRTKNGEECIINKHNIVGLDSAISYSIARSKVLALRLSKIKNELERLSIEDSMNDEKDMLFTSDKMVEIFDKSIKELDIDQEKVKRELERVQKEKSEINKMISSKTQGNNEVATGIFKDVVRFISELEIPEYEKLASSYIYTSNLKELSGAVLQKLVFAFKLAYILEVKKQCKVILPIVMDSPRSKELTFENYSKMVDILKRDFADHQIIVASVYNDNFQDRIIEFKERLFIN